MSFIQNDIIQTGAISFNNNFDEITLMHSNEAKIEDSFGRQVPVFPSAGKYEVYHLSFDLLKSEMTFFIKVPQEYESRRAVYSFRISLIRDSKIFVGTINEDIRISIY